MKQKLAILAAGLVLTSIATAQQPVQPPVIDVESYDIQIEIIPERSFLAGELATTFSVLEDTLSIPFEFNKNLSIISVTSPEGDSYNLSADSYGSGRLRVQGEEPFRAGERKTLVIRWDGTLEREQYAFLNLPFNGKAFIDRDGALLLSEAHWFPSHMLPTDVARGTLKATVPLGYSAVTSGELGSIETVGVSEVFNWTTPDEVGEFPLVVSEFYRQTIDSGSIPLTFFVRDDFESDLNAMAAEIEAVINFMDSEYGTPPVNSLVIVEVADTELAVGGSRGLILLEKSFIRAPSVPVAEIARTVARQWWGYSVRPMSNRDAWLQDGFATFSALRYLEEKHPELHATQLAREAVQALKHQEKAPIVEGFDLDAGSPEYESIVSSKGAWVLNMLSQLIGADQLRASMRDWYFDKAGKAASISEFVSLVQSKSKDDLNWFFVQWIESVGVPEFIVDYTIFKVSAGGFKIRGQLKQDIDLFKMPLDILIETKGETEEKTITAVGKSTSFTFETETLPTRIQVDPEGKILMDSDQMRVAVLIAMGDEYKDTGEYVSAISEYERAIALDPRSSLGHYRLGEVFFDQNSYSNAANSFRDSLNGDLKPEWVETWTHIYLGKVYDILGQRQRAMAEYQKAINSRIDYNGAQAEAQKYLEKPFATPSSLIGG